MEVHGWRTFAHPLFEKQLEKLTRQVERLEVRDPKGYSAQPATKILATLNHYIRETIPRDLDNGQLQPWGHWFRARFHSRYQLYYRVSRPQRIILYVWVRNEHDSRTGPFGMFRELVERGDASVLGARTE